MLSLAGGRQVTQELKRVELAAAKARKAEKELYGKMFG
jgi:hypothetical protein